VRDKILHTASQLFISMGVKSVTMDDIAERMAISKKTIYEFYENKYELVKATTFYLFENITNQIKSICDNHAECPIVNLFEINIFLREQLKDDNSPVLYQLKKYYPEIYEDLHLKKFAIITEGITENLERGIQLGLYREDINIPIIARFYYTGIDSINNNEIFPIDQFKSSHLTRSYLIYHIRAIATHKGIEELENYIKTNEL
jgi:AcrR family transcriptional regulator